MAGADLVAAGTLGALSTLRCAKLCCPLCCAVPLPWAVACSAAMHLQRVWPSAQAVQAQWLRESEKAGRLQVMSCCRLGKLPAVWQAHALAAAAHAAASNPYMCSTLPCLLPFLTSQAEISAECGRVQRFIIDREIEAPERFQAIQSYRWAHSRCCLQIDCAGIMQRCQPLRHAARMLHHCRSGALSSCRSADQSQQAGWGRARPSSFTWPYDHPV